VRLWKRGAPPEPDPQLRIVVGLGNPGGRYENTRHNVGFMVIRAIAARFDLHFRRSKHRAELASGTVEGVPVLLALPITYVNESGNAVRRLLQYYRVPLSQLLVVCDDIDLPFGTLRLRPGGSSGGHKGLKSIIEALGNEEFARLRVGVGRPEASAVGHVLGPFSRDEAALLPALVDTSADAALAWLEGDMKAAMNRFNRDWLPALHV
jgi:peptidyl-tRNA hydrolase, PTH1 family